jgi:hypothetical protein
MTALATHTRALTRTHTAVFVTDKMRNLLKVLITHHGLNPESLVQGAVGRRESKGHSARAAGARLNRRYQHRLAYWETVR